MCRVCLFTDSAPPSGTNSAKQSPSAQHRAMGQQPPSYPDRYTNTHTRTPIRAKAFTQAPPASIPQEGSLIQPLSTKSAQILSKRPLACATMWPISISCGPHLPGYPERQNPPLPSPHTPPWSLLRWRSKEKERLLGSLPSSLRFLFKQDYLRQTFLIHC